MVTWKKVNGYANYSVSTTGQVKNDKTGKLLSPALDSNGYYFVILCKDGKKWHGYLHQLVATAFIPNPRSLREIHHRDENKQNNHKDNLRWCTHTENMNYSRKHRATTAKKAVLCVETGEAYKSIGEAARAVGRSPTAIVKCLNNQTRTCAGLHWRCLYDFENRSDPGREGYDLWLCKKRWEDYYGIPESEGVV